MQTDAYPDVMTKDTSIEKLQDCYQGELAAVETYTLALETKGIAHVGLHRALQEMLTSHARRAERIHDKIERWGGAPPSTSGVWGTFAKAIQAGADLLGYRMAVAALEEGEERGLRIYTEGLEGCDATTRELIETELLPEQQRTHELCRTLHEYLDAPT